MKRQRRWVLVGAIATGLIAAGGAASSEASHLVRPESAVFHKGSIYVTQMGNALAFRGDATADGSIVVVNSAAQVQKTLATGLVDPTGMAVIGDTLWVNDADRIRSFDLRTGAAGVVRDLSSVVPARTFLNDLVADRSGQLWATNTFTNRIHVVRTNGEVASFALPDEFRLPNGIAVHPKTGQLWFLTSAPTLAGGGALARITSSGYALVRRDARFQGLDGLVFVSKKISTKPKPGKKRKTKVVTAAMFSDGTTGKIWTLADGKLSVRATLAGGPADIGYAPPLGRLLVPLLQEGGFTTLKP